MVSGEGDEVVVEAGEGHKAGKIYVGVCLQLGSINSVLNKKYCMPCTTHFY